VKLKKVSRGEVEVWGTTPGTTTTLATTTPTTTTYATTHVSTTTGEEGIKFQGEFGDFYFGIKLWKTSSMYNISFVNKVVFFMYVSQNNKRHIYLYVFY